MAYGVFKDLPIGKASDKLLDNEAFNVIWIWFLLSAFDIYDIMMMTLKFSRNAKVTCTLTGRRPVRPAVDDDFES